MKTYWSKILFAILLITIFFIVIPSVVLSNIGALLFVKGIAGCGSKLEMDLLQKGKTCSGNYQAIQKNFINTALHVDRYNASAKRYLGISYLFAGLPQDAYLTLGAKITDAKRYDAINEYWLAWAMYLKDQAQGAKEHWSDINAWRRLNDIAERLELQGTTTEALTWYRNTLDVLYESSINTEYYIGLGAVNYNIATIYYNQGEISTAIPYYLAAVNYMPGRIDYTYQLATVLKQQGEYGTAQQVLMKALEIHPSSGSLCGSLGEVYLAMESWPAAESVLNRCLVIDKDKYWKARTRFDLSILFCKTGDYELCLTDTIASVDELQLLDPGWEYQIGLNFNVVLAAKQSAEAYINVGDFYLRYGKVSEAKRVFQLAAQLWPENKILEQRLLQIMPGDK